MGLTNRGTTDIREIDRTDDRTEQTDRTRCFHLRFSYQDKAVDIVLAKGAALCVFTPAIDLAHNPNNACDSAHCPCSYSVNFADMTQTNVVTGYVFIFLSSQCGKSFI